MVQKIFLTGGSGYIGTAVIAQALAANKTVHALSRTPTSDAQLIKQGAIPIRGDLTTLDVLREESAAADAVIHLATAYTLATESYDTVMPIDIAAVDAIADGLAGSGKPLVVTSGTLVVAADPSGNETNEESAEDADPINSRGKTEAYSLGLGEMGIKVSAVRVAPYVYGNGGSGVRMFMEMSVKAGSVVCVNGGVNRTTVVHVDDLARLFLLAVERGGKGEVYNASSETTVTAREIFDGIAEILGVGVRDIGEEEALQQMGRLFTLFLKTENRASGEKARRELGWVPKEVGILEDIRGGSYKKLAAELRG